MPAPAPPGPAPAVALTADTLRRFAPKARPDYVTVLGEKGNDVLTRFGINKNANRFCHFMAQVGHECGGFTIVEESLNYSAKRMVQIFGPQIHSAGITASEAERLVGKNEAFAERVYGLGNPRKAKDLGNTKPGDGYRYRGRGFLQITGRSAYREAGQRLGVELEADPDKVGQPLYALMTAAAFWDSRKLNAYADQDNIEIITKRINGGHNGLKDRKERYEKAVEIWGEDGDPTATRGRTKGADRGRRTLEYGDLGADVVVLKRMLEQAGYDGFEMDEDFSRATHMAVVQLKLDHGLPGDGIVDAETWDILQRQADEAGPTTRSATRVPTAPEATVENGRNEQARDRGRGRTVVFWGLVLLLAAAALAALKAVENPRLLASPSFRDWVDLGFAGLVGIAALALIYLGSRIAGAARSNRAAATARQRSTPRIDEGIRPEVNTGGD